MALSSTVTLVDVAGAPSVRLELPMLRRGDRLTLAFHLHRRNGGRSEQLVVTGAWMVVGVEYDATGPRTRQILKVESANNRPPPWKAVKRPQTWDRRLAPARSPRTTVA